MHFYDAPATPSVHEIFLEYNKEEAEDFTRILCLDRLSTTK